MLVICAVVAFCLVGCLIAIFVLFLGVWFCFDADFVCLALFCCLLFIVVA